MNPTTNPVSSIFDIHAPEKEKEKLIDFSQLNRANRRKFGKLYGGAKINGSSRPFIKQGK